MSASRSGLADACRRHGVLACYLFGSRADDGLAALDGSPVIASGSDLDVGVFFLGGQTAPSHHVLASLQVSLEDVFAPLRVDLVPLDRVDPLFQYAAISGHRVVAADTGRVDRLELRVMRTAAELLPRQRAIERDLFGTSTR